MNQDEESPRNFSGQQVLALGDPRGHGVLGCDFHVDCWSRLTVESGKPSAQPGRPSQHAPCMGTTSLAAAYSFLLNIYLGLHFLPLTMYAHVVQPEAALDLLYNQAGVYVMPAYVFRAYPWPMPVPRPEVMPP